MNCLALLSVIIVFNSVDSNIKNNLEQICDILKPNGVFTGIKVYQKINQNVYLMYGKGKEWQFVVKNRTILLENSITDIQPKERSDWNSSLSELVSLKFNVNNTNEGQTDDTIDCYIIRFEISIQIFCNEFKETKHRTVFQSQSMIAFNPSFTVSQVIGLLDTTNRSNVFFYDPFNDDLKDINGCEECVVPLFLADISEQMLRILDGIIVFKEQQKSWLLFFNNNSKPLICIINETTNFAEGCKEENLSEYGKECLPKSDPNKNTTEYLVPKISDEITTDSGKCRCGQTTPTVDKWWISNRFLILFAALLAFFALDLGLCIGYCVGRLPPPKKSKSAESFKSSDKTKKMVTKKLSPKAKNELGISHKQVKSSESVEVFKAKDPDSSDSI